MVWKALDPEPFNNLYKSFFILAETWLFSITYFLWIIIISKFFGLFPVNSFFFFSCVIYLWVFFFFLVCVFFFFFNLFLNNFFLMSLITSAWVLNASPNNLSFLSFHSLPTYIPTHSPHTYTPAIQSSKIISKCRMFYSVSLFRASPPPPVPPPARS